MPSSTAPLHTLSLHDALPISRAHSRPTNPPAPQSSTRDATSTTLSAKTAPVAEGTPRSEEHTSELQSLRHLVCRLLLEKKTEHTRGFGCASSLPPQRAI